MNNSETPVQLTGMRAGIPLYFQQRIGGNAQHIAKILTNIDKPLELSPQMVLVESGNTALKQFIYILQVWIHSVSPMSHRTQCGFS